MAEVSLQFTTRHASLPEHTATTKGTRRQLQSECGTASAVALRSQQTAGPRGPPLDARTRPPGARSILVVLTGIGLTSAFGPSSDHDLEYDDIGGYFKRTAFLGDFAHLRTATPALGHMPARIWHLAAPPSLPPLQRVPCPRLNLPCLAHVCPPSPPSLRMPRRLLRVRLGAPAPPAIAAIAVAPREDVGQDGRRGDSRLGRRGRFLHCLLEDFLRGGCAPLDRQGHTVACLATAALASVPPQPRSLCLSSFSGRHLGAL